MEKSAPSTTTAGNVYIAATTASSAAAAAAVTAPSTLAISDFIVRFDEAAKRRLENMNKKLRDLEIQMEVLEAEMDKANQTSPWSF